MSILSTIFATENNIGNSVVDLVIKNGVNQYFGTKFKFTINVYHVLSILNTDDHDTNLVKMDASARAYIA